LSFSGAAYVSALHKFDLDWIVQISYLVSLVLTLVLNSVLVATVGFELRFKSEF